MNRLFLFCCLMFAVVSVSLDKSLQDKKASSSQVDGLNFFLGKWSCDGKFAKSGKDISADVSFEPVLEGKWILFRHDDRPPFSYHAISEWGWDAKNNVFVSTIQDSAGGLRWFHSHGWSGQKLTWDSDDEAADVRVNQRFEFDRLGTDQFKVTYSVQRGGEWANVDASICKKSGM